MRTRFLELSSRAGEARRGTSPMQSTLSAPKEARIAAAGSLSVLQRLGMTIF